MELIALAVSVLIWGCSVAPGDGLDNGLARTPPMGWLNWERFRCITDCDQFPDECISEALFKRTADRLVEDGYLALGYEYVIVDDCWMEMERDEDGRLVADRKRFPSGMKALADYMHERGLKFGIYEDYGTKTCAGYPGVLNHMEIDAQTFADWGVDYVKLDGCYSEVEDMDIGYPEFGRLLNETGRPMVYSCSWPVYQEVNGIIPNYEAMKAACNLWRNWYDIDDSWESVRTITKYFANNQDRIQNVAGPGHWNDPDMLIIGNFGLSIDQSKAQMAIWAILAAPLLMSNDLDRIRPEFREILQNREIIAVNQDPLGMQGRRIRYTNNIEVWVRPITPSWGVNYSYAVAFVSHRTDGAPYTLNLDAKSLGLKSPLYMVHDLYDKSSRSRFMASRSSKLRVRINPSGVVFYKFEALNPSAAPSSNTV
ncbi:alpha-N-acetylgalactosaminidase-like [Phlebotomus argentipes]|uniref:alpha-N-acetylgalactosaminidase-like n=1 Tax=Phlebotomus argentipes TaxID=94469 RepID=UPI002892E25A|nr:alpha-N-acetylgalactosaminidase-like [Phlebotomus argentipes]